MQHEQEQKTREIIMLMIENERAMAGLYLFYANHLSNFDFWQKLHKEESVHAQWLEALIEPAKSQSEAIYLNPQNFNVAALKSSIDYIAKLIKSDADSIDALTALGVSLSIEESLIEKEYFTVFESDSESVKHVLNDLAEETKNHIERVKSEMERIKFIQ